MLSAEAINILRIKMLLSKEAINILLRVFFWGGLSHDQSHGPKTYPTAPAPSAGSRRAPAGKALLKKHYQ